MFQRYDSIMLLKLLRAALSPRPKSSEFINRSLALRREGRLAEATQVLREAAARFPQDAVIATNVGVFLLEQDLGPEGVRWLERALELDSACAPAHFNLANIMRSSGERTLAVQHYQAAVDADPAFAPAREQLMNCLLEVCDWDRADKVAADLRAQIERNAGGNWMRGISPLTAVTLGLTPQQVRQVSAWHAAECARGIQPAARSVPNADIPERLRVGYLSRDLRNHAVGHVVANVFASHDRRRFEIHAFSYGIDDGSQYRKTIAAGVDRFVDAHRMSDDELAAAISSAGIHVLIDLAGHTTGNRMAVLARRPAPVQAHYLGFAATTGAPFIDYFISDPIATPPGMAADFTEKIVYVPHSFMVSDGSDAAHVAADAPLVQSAFSPESTVFCNFNNGSRITRGDFDVWMEILKGVAGSVLWLQAANASTVSNLHALAQASGVDPARLVFAQRVPTKREHFARLNRADLMLDTIGWHNGHSTASDALWAGVPVLTVPGRYFANRVAASLATAAGLPDFVRSDRADYVRTAIELARGRDRLAAAKRELAGRSAPFFDTRNRVRDLEETYLEMWRLSALRRPGA